MMQLKAILLALAVISVGTQAKPSHYLHNLHQTALPDHFDLAPPVLPAPHFHAAPPAPEPAWLPAPPAPLAPEAAFYPIPAPAPAPLLPIPPPAPVLPSLPAPALWPAAALPPPAPLLPAPISAPVLPAPAPALPAVHTHLVATPELHLPAALPALPAVTLETIPIAPSYRVIPGPKTTTHHVSVGYAFPKLAAPHAHLHAAPLKLISHHHHHSLF